MKNVLLIGLLSLFFTSLYAQQEEEKKSTEIIESTLKKLNAKWETGNISERDFVKTTDSTLASFQRLGIFMPPKNYLPLLEPFRQALWKNKEFSKNRNHYYYTLMNSADVLGLGGESIFYAEKYEIQAKEDGEDPGLVVEYMKAAFYVSNNNFKEAIDVYEKSKQHFEQYAGNAIEDSKGITMIHTIEYAQLIARAYTKENKLQKANELTDKISGIIDNYSKKHNTPSRFTHVYTLYYYFLKTEVALANKNYPTALTYLEQSDELLNNPKNNFGPVAQFVISSQHQYWLDYFLAIGNYEMAKKQLDKLEKNGSPYSTFSTDMNNYKAKLAAIHGDYKLGYAFMDTVFKEQTIDKASLSNQVTQLLYAKAQSELNAFQLAAEEKEKIRFRNLTIWISAISLAVICLISFYIFRSRIKTKRQFKQINQLTEIQIEHIRKQAQSEEQQQIAQELHDDYSNALGAVKLKLEGLKQEEQAQENASLTGITQELTKVHSLINSLYESIREKSHSIYSGSDHAKIAFLNNSIRQMIDVVAKDSRAKKEIDIDPQVIKTLPEEHQIEILRIIQECFSNILKHGKNSIEIFVFLFQNEDKIELHIGNIGEFKKSATSDKGLGLESIRKRVQKLFGKIAVEKEDGFVLNVEIPIP